MEVVDHGAVIWIVLDVVFAAVLLGVCSTAIWPQLEGVHSSEVLGHRRVPLEVIVFAVGVDLSSELSIHAQTTSLLRRLRDELLSLFIGASVCSHQLLRHQVILRTYGHRVAVGE